MHPGITDLATRVIVTSALGILGLSILITLCVWQSRRASRSHVLPHKCPSPCPYCPPVPTTRQNGS